jgi:hypothetical protein
MGPLHLAHPSWVSSWHCLVRLQISIFAAHFEYQHDFQGFCHEPSLRSEYEVCQVGWRRWAGPQVAAKSLLARAEIAAAEL